MTALRDRLRELVGFHGPASAEERTRTADTADAVTRRQRAVIGPSDAEKNGDTSYNTALRFIKDWIEVFSTNSAPYLDNSVQNEIDWRREKTLYCTVAMRPDGLSVSSAKVKAVVSWNEFITGDLTEGQDYTISLNTKILFVSKPYWRDVFGFLAMLQRVLRGKSIWEAELCAADAAAYPNPDATANIDHFIQRNQNLLHDDSFDPAKESLFRTCLRIPANDKILLAHMSDTIFKSNFGKGGWAITPKGIYEHSVSVNFMNWSEFAKTKLSFFGDDLSVPNGILLKAHKIPFAATGKRYAQYLDFFLALRAYARRIAYAG